MRIEAQRGHGRLIATAVLIASVGLFALVPRAQAAFGVAKFDVAATNSQGDLFAQAGGHPYEVSTMIEWNNHTDEHYFAPMTVPDGDVNDAFVDLPPGFVGNPTGLPECQMDQLVDTTERYHSFLQYEVPNCPTDSQVGIVKIYNTFSEVLHSNWAAAPLFLMKPPHGSAARFGFNIVGVPILLDAGLRNNGEYGITVFSKNVPQGLKVPRIEVMFWGVPQDPSHNSQRCMQPSRTSESEVIECRGSDPADANYPQPSGTRAQPFITMPTSCSQAGTGLPWALHTSQWSAPNVYVNAEIQSHEFPGFPLPQNEWGAPRGTENCGIVPFEQKLTAQPTQQSAASPTGLTAEVTVPDDGLLNPKGIAESTVREVTVYLPEGMTLNPAQGEGLGTCSPAQYAQEDVEVTGCPADSKIGTVTVKSPLLKETLEGSVYVAKPFDNPFNSLLALYLVIKNADRGVNLKLAGEVEPNEKTGQIVTTFKNVPQLPFTSFVLHLREGQRAPLATPAVCGTYTTKAVFVPWSDPTSKVTSFNSFDVTSGIGGGSCPTGGLPRFKPGLIAGTVNNRAGSYSPFNVRLFRSDEEQEITNFSIKLPPGVIGKLAGVGYCSDAAVALAKSREGAPGGGQQEIDSPSCPASSQVGTTLVGAGVGSVLAYAPGKLYYAGPYHGSAISLVSITAAKVGPFDLGTVVVRFALRVNPETAEIFIDATGSDPIPHIISGITTHLRDIRGYTDRPEFVLNPTSCERTSTASTVLGSGLDFASTADDLPVTVATPFQAADCAALPFKPKLALSLSGETKRAGNPKLKAVFTPRPGEANLASAQVTLPKSEFLDNAHIGTVCTRVQFNAGARPGDACPPASIYGHAVATSPLVDYPLEGNLFLRSNPEHELPDLVAAFHGPAFDVNAVARVDSVKGGGIRTTFESVPDAPLTKVVLTMAGGKKGLLENSADLCAAKHRATVALDGHNGKTEDFKPVVKPSCGKHGQHKPTHQASPQPSNPYRGR